MGTRVRTATVELLDFVTGVCECTDYRLAQLMGFSHVSVVHWRDGARDFRDENIERACELAGVLHLTWYWLILIGSERKKTGKCYRRLADAIGEILWQHAEGMPATTLEAQIVVRDLTGEGKALETLRNRYLARVQKTPRTAAA